MIHGNIIIVWGGGILTNMITPFRYFTENIHCNNLSNFPIVTQVQKYVLYITYIIMTLYYV